MSKTNKISPPSFLILFLILLGGFFVRVYRVGKILGFYFDQGRDALVIWDLIHSHKFFLIGPTTGIAGIFRGPFYYYLIAPFYWLGRGDPTWPAIFLAFTTIFASALAFHLGKKIHSTRAGLLAAFISCFSFNIVLASRWLSNPTPMLVLSMLLVFSMLKITKGKKLWWPVLSFIAGLSLFHFGSSGEFFYFPALFLFLIWQRKTLNTKIIFWSITAFLLTASPLIIFDLRHENILSSNIKAFLFGEDSFKSSFTDIIKTRLNFYYDVFTNKIFQARGIREIRVLAIIAAFFMAFLPRFIKNTGIKVLLLLLLSPMIGLLFFQGNYGNIYDYYMTGYYMIFILLFSITLAEITKTAPGMLFVLYFLWIFTVSNTRLIRYKITAGTDGPQTIALENQLQAIDWIYKDTGNSNFNTDVYVPPVIPYAYDYLFLWRGTTKYHHLASPNQEPTLYTLYEVDPPHPERLEAWYSRQEGIAKVEKQEKFGGISVQKRIRYEK